MISANTFLLFSVGLTIGMVVSVLAIAHGAAADAALLMHGSLIQTSF